MKANEVRNSFLKFFENKQHEIVPSAPVVPYDDPTLLFTNAGMNQFKNIFLDLEERHYKRAADTQKCIRVSGKHNDLEDVGFDTYHHTFFEMLGNWSFGDYFKKEAIQWAWELLTDVWDIPKDRLYATVFGGDPTDALDADTEAERFWKEVTDIDPEHVLRFGKNDNFWEMGESGPCGPCSEIHIDLTPDGTGGKLVNAGDPLVIEIWNLVFIQYNRGRDGILSLLPAQHVDTGMGFERLCAVINGSNSNYDTDLFTPILAAITDMTGIAYRGDETGFSHRVIADHVRALSFAIADGAMPSNEGRGYVLRRILRRAARFGRNLNMREPFIYRLVPVVVDIMGDTFPELKEKHQFITMVIKAEEESFNATLDRGLEIYDKIIAGLRKSGRTEIAGADAFKLYDTYGFPLDLTQVMARQQGLRVDEKGFEAAMADQRARARKAGKWTYTADFEYDNWTTLSEGADSKFLGYQQTEAEAQIRKFICEHDRVFVTLDQTPFYGEAGGQVGDVGEIIGTGFRIVVLDTIRDGNTFVHIGEVDDTAAMTSPQVRAVVDKNRRQTIACNHTATHLLHKALRQTLGTHVTQAGSLVAPDHLRFDVTHFQRITPEEIEKIEFTVNEKIRGDLAVSTTQMSYVEAREKGAMAIFEEKYGDRVRVVEIGDFSMELCGGTHLRHTGEIGYFRILTESSAAAGIRRLEAATAEYADQLLRSEKRITHEIQSLLNCTIEEVAGKIRSLLDDKHTLEKELTQLRVQSAGQVVVDLVNAAREVNGYKVVAAKIASENNEELKQIGDELRLKLRSGVGVLTSVSDRKINFICVVTDDLISGKGLKAGDIVKQVAAITGGGGGGRPHMALAGGKDIAKVDEALSKVIEIVEKIAKQYEN